MPSKSPEQHRLMEAVAHDPAFAKKTEIPQSVGREFSNADDKRVDSENFDSVSSSIAAYMRAVSAGDARGIAAIPWANHHGDG
jgi:hypothetical protein